MAKLINEIGNIYGDLTVISRAENHINPNGKPRVQWNCLCKCGNTCIVLGESLRQGRTKSCGKCDRSIRNRERASDKVCKEMLGKIYNYLKVLAPGSYDVEISGKRRRKVICQCLLCGDIIETRVNWIKNGTIGSCGKHSKSRGEIHVKDFLTSINCNFKDEYTFNDLSDKGKLRFDFAILNNENKVIMCIEIQGNQHYDCNNGWYNSDVITHDKMKKEYCINNNIPLLIFDYSKGQVKTDFIAWDNQILQKLKEINNGIRS